MGEPPKHPDVARIFTRLLDSLGLNAAQLARKIGSTPQAISNYLVGRNEPGRKMLAQIIEAYPNIDAGWLTTGTGEPFPTGRYDEKPAAAEEPAAPAYTPPPAVSDHVGKLLDELNRQAAHYRDELKQARDSYDSRLDASSRQWQYTVDRMADQLDEKRALITRLEQEVFELKLAAGRRQPTAEEAEALAKQAEGGRRKPVKGLRNYEEEVPELVEMVAVRGESDFSRLLPLEEEVFYLSKAA